MRFTSIFLIVILGISLSQQFSSPADAVLNKIDRLVQGTRDEQAAQTRIFVIQTARYRHESAYRNQEIADAVVARGAANQQLAICKAEVPVAVSALRQSRAELALSSIQLQALEKEHQWFTKVNLARQQEHQQALVNIQGAYNIIGNFANGKRALNSKPVFVEVAEQMNSIFKIAVKHQFHAEMIPVMAALVEITQVPATQVSTSALTKVVNLLRKLEAGVKQSEARRAHSQGTYAAQYKLSQSLLLVQVASLKTIILKYRAYLGKLRLCVRTESNIFNLAQAKFVRNSNILAATVQLYNAYDVKYKQQSAQRADYVVLLTKLRAYINKAIAQFDHGLYSRHDFVNTL